MSLVDKLVSSFLAFELDINIQSPVHNIRTQAIKEFEKLGFPNKKLEAWKYTSLKNILKEDYTIFSKKKNVLEFKNVQNYFLDNTETYKLVFVDGSFDPFLSQTSHDGVDICILSAALTKPVYSKVISKYFDTSVNKEDSLSLLNPIEHGANIVIHSLTKYINGNGTALGGVIIDAGTFDWSSGKFPEFTEPSPGYHGLIYHDAIGAAAFIAKVRIEGLRDLGGALSPFNAFQIIQGLETLDIRIKKHSSNALELAKWLEKRSEVEWVNYPGLESSNYNSLAKKYLPKGQSGIVTFGVKGGYESAKTVADKTSIFSLLANIGDTKSLIIHPASTTHQQLGPEDQASTGVTSDLIRLSVGLEDIEDLKKDLELAFSKIDSKVLV